MPLFFAFGAHRNSLMGSFRILMDKEIGQCLFVQLFVNPLKKAINKIWVPKMAGNYKLKTESY